MCHVIRFPVLSRFPVIYGTILQSSGPINVHYTNLKVSKALAGPKGNRALRDHCVGRKYDIEATSKKEIYHGGTYGRWYGVMEPDGGPVRTQTLFFFFFFNYACPPLRYDAPMCSWSGDLHPKKRSRGRPNTDSNKPPMSGILSLLGYMAFAS